MAYYSGLPGSSYDWAYSTVAQPNAGNRTMYWPCGKVLGGSSAMNGMYHVRPSQVEIDAWAGLIDGGDKWKWDNFFQGLQNSETFTPPSSDVQAIAKIEYDASSRGTKGPIHASYPGLCVLPIIHPRSCALITCFLSIASSRPSAAGPRRLRTPASRLRRTRMAATAGARTLRPHLSTHPTGRVHTHDPATSTPFHRATILRSSRTPQSLVCSSTTRTRTT